MLYTYYHLGKFLFFIGFSGIMFNKRNLLFVLLSLEIMLLGISFIFIYNSLLLDDLLGQLLILFLLVLAGVESALGLALFVLYYKLRGSIELDYLTLLKG